MDTSQRLDRLEKLYEDLYHRVELYEIHTSKIADVLIKYFPTSERYRKELAEKISQYRGLISIHENDITGLKKAYHTHTDKKKNYRNIL